MLFKILANDNVKIIFWLVVYVCFQVLALCRIEEPVLRLRGNLRRQLPPPSLPIFQQTTPQKQNCPRVLAVGYGRVMGSNLWPVFCSYLLFEYLFRFLKALTQSANLKEEIKVQ